MVKKEKEKKPVRKKVAASKPTVKSAPRKKEKAPAAKHKKSAGILIQTRPALKKSASKPAKVEPLTQQDLDHFRHLLLEKRAELLGDVKSIESEALKKSRLDAAGDLSSMPIHMADLGTDNFEQEFSLGLMASERKLLSEINAALKRIDDGTFGICEGTGELISRSRLEANPWARFTIDYASRMEKGGYFEPFSSSFSSNDDGDDHEKDHDESEDTESSEEEIETEAGEESPGLFILDEDEEEEEKEEKEY